MREKFADFLFNSIEAIIHFVWLSIQCIICFVLLYLFLRISAYLLGYDWNHPENNKDDDN